MKAKFDKIMATFAEDRKQPNSTSNGPPVQEKI